MSLTPQNNKHTEEKTAHLYFKRKPRDSYFKNNHDNNRTPVHSQASRRFFFCYCLWASPLPLYYDSISRPLRQREPMMDGRMDAPCRGVSPQFPLGQPVCWQSPSSRKMVSLANSTANRQLLSLYISPKKTCLNLFFYTAYFIIIHI